MRLIVIFMGLFDLNAALLLSALAFNYEVPTKVLIFVLAILFLKGCICITDVGSIMDFVAVFLIVLSIFFHLPFWILLIGSALIGFKGIRSFGV